MIIPTVSAALGVLGIAGIKADVVFDLDFSGGLYGLYVLIGYGFFKYKDFLANCMKDKRILICVNVIGGGMYFAIVGLEVYAYSLGHQYNVAYDFPLLPLIVSCIFYSLLQIKISDKESRFLVVGAEDSFGVYLVHVLILNVLIEKIGIVGNRSFELIWMAVMVYGMSELLVQVLGKMPGGEKLFMRKKRKTGCNN